MALKWQNWLSAGLVAFGTGGCTTVLPEHWLFDRPIVLLGEVHDNAQGHALRLRAFDTLLATGARPALLLEQFDIADQPAIDSARQSQPAPSAAVLVAAVMAARRPPPVAAAVQLGGWEWRFYEPFIDRALRLGLPIVAANLGRDDARKVMREGLALRGFNAAVPEAVLNGLAAAIEASHCGQVGATLSRSMALAQVARDQQMARALLAHAGRGVVLLAGNGHVRIDVGVPLWLDAETRLRTLAVGVLEEGDTTAAFDHRVWVQPQQRPDPCASMKKPVQAGQSDINPQPRTFR